MKRYVVVFMVLLLTPALFGNTLWDQAVELYQEHQDLTPGRMEVRFVQYNGKGELVQSDESEIELYVDGSGEVQSRIIYARRDGEDVTQERREDPGSGGGGPFGGGGDDDGDGGGFAGLQRSPFDPAEQSNVTITRVGRLRRIDGILTREFEYEHQTGRNSRNTGTAWLHVETGEPVRLEVTIKPLPPLVSDFMMRQEFDRDSEGRWIVEQMEFSGAGSLLFFTRRIESEMVFSDYFRSPEGSLY